MLYDIILINSEGEDVLRFGANDYNSCGPYEGGPYNFAFLLLFGFVLSPHLVSSGLIII